MFAENDLEIAQKAIMALENGMQVIFCCGETLEEREEGNAENVVESQVVGSLSLLIDLDPRKLIIAYEPVWAIGTGKTASPAQAVEMHQSIRKTVTKYFTKEFAQSVSILYGGSVKGSNAAELFANEDIDGALVGGASLDANDFCTIIKAFS
jgi:triosephosphate isomerase